MAPPVDIQLPLVAEVSKPISSVPSTDPSQFNPSRHLAYQTPSKILKMGDIALEASPISSVAATEPFPLLSREAVLQHRREIFSEDVLSNCMHYTRPGSVQIRGMAPRYAPFIHQFWHSPEILKIISENAGVDLVPAMDYEICHTNVQLGPAGLEGVKATPVEPPEATETAIQQFEQAKPKKEATSQEKPIIEWHKDSHPFVCVVMLSDARFMEGGETELQCGDGTTLKVKAPQMGSATILQGRYITHTAAPTENMPERVTIVTSFRPRNPTLLDDTTNANVRNKSHLSELYYQWTTYRLEVLAERARLGALALREKYAQNVEKSDNDGKSGLCRIETVNIKEVEEWAREQIKYIEQTLHEMRPLDANGR